MTTEQRIERLEASLRVCKAMVVCILAVAAVYLFAGADGEDSVRGTRFELVNSKGNVTAVLSMENEEGEATSSRPNLRFYDDKGAALAEYGLLGVRFWHIADPTKRSLELRNFSGLSINDQHGNQKIRLYLQSDGTGVVKTFE